MCEMSGFVSTGNVSDSDQTGLSYAYLRLLLQCLLNACWLSGHGIPSNLSAKTLHRLLFCAN